MWERGACVYFECQSCSWEMNSIIIRKKIHVSELFFIFQK